MTTFINISKLDAAKRQLETAILIFFNSGDIVSLHTLVAASHQLLLDLGKEQGIKSLLKDSSLELIREEKRKEWLQAVSKAENFFKHADKDKNAQLKFNPDSSEMMIWDACLMYGALTKEMPPIISLFDMWYKLKNPHFFPESYQAKFKEIKTTIDSTNKGEFLGLLKYINPVRLPGQ